MGVEGVGVGLRVVERVWVRVKVVVVALVTVTVMVMCESEGYGFLSDAEDRSLLEEGEDGRDGTTRSQPREERLLVCLCRGAHWHLYACIYKYSCAWIMCMHACTHACEEAPTGTVSCTRQMIALDVKC